MEGGLVCHPRKRFKPVENTVLSLKRPLTLLRNSTPKYYIFIYES